MHHSTMLTYSTCMHVILNTITNECLTTVPCCVSHVTVAPILVNGIDQTLNSFDLLGVGDRKICAVKWNGSWKLICNP